MARTPYFLLALCFWLLCDGVSTRILLIDRTLRGLDKLRYQDKELSGCPQLMALNILSMPHITGEHDPTIEETFRLASKLFQKNVTQSKWDSNTLREVQDLLHRLHSDRPTSGPIPTLAAVQTHFEQLEDLLSQENFSMCAWETVRTQMRFTLHRFHKDLCGSMRIPANLSHLCRKKRRRD